VLAIRPALTHDNVTLLTRATVVRLDTNPAGTAVTQVVVDHGGHLERYRGDIVVLSCGAANTAKLLLGSANETHPSGLANGSDEVGRNYMFQYSQALLALSQQPNPTVFQKTLGINDFYFRGPDFDFPMGSIQMLGKSRPVMYRGEKPLETKLAPNWSLADVAGHAVDFLLSTEDLPRSENRVVLDRDSNVRLRYQPGNPTAGRALYRQLKSMLGVMGMHEGQLIHRFPYLKSDMPLAATAHQAGTCRFGADPNSSVLDRDCKAHELDNLYVVDTSFFPSIGAVNPALTAMANALRVGDHLLDRLRG
jgi:choline dehydrogenase-like flavoprotein